VVTKIIKNINPKLTDTSNQQPAYSTTSEVEVSEKVKNDWLKYSLIKQPRRNMLRHVLHIPVLYQLHNKKLFLIVLYQYQ